MAFPIKRFYTDMTFRKNIGQAVKTWHYSGDNRFNISDLPKGSYLLSVDKDKKQVPLKFIKY